jgi:hypothetical protein
MLRARRGSLVVVSLMAGLLLTVGRAAAAKPKGGKPDEIRAYLDKATAAFALNHYPEAAENYEKAFALRPDPAVLYNAAQAHRLGGNKARALELYESYLRMYGSEKRAEIEKHIENLKQAIEKDRAVATSPPTTPAPVGTTIAAPPPPPEPAPAESPSATAKAETPPLVAPPPPPVAPPPPPPEPAKPVLVAQPSPPADGGSLATKPWFWIVVGGVVAAGVVTTLLLVGRDPSDPVSTLEPVPGN